jgi:predicted  nucleic acid-binding Zn-ribbon protein
MMNRWGVICWLGMASLFSGCAPSATEYHENPHSSKTYSFQDVQLKKDYVKNQLQHVEDKIGKKEHRLEHATTNAQREQLRKDLEKLYRKRQSLEKELRQLQ